MRYHQSENLALMGTMRQLVRHRAAVLVLIAKKYRSMDNVCPEGTEEKYVTSTRGEALGRNVNVRRSERIRNYPQWYNPGFGDAREWNNDDVASIVYMIQDGDFDSNVDTDDILSLLAEWDAEDCMDTPSTFHMR